MQASKLIADAYYLSGEVSREFSTVTTTQTADGLQWLNENISQLSINATLIPYLTHYELPTETGEEIYTVTGLVAIDVVTFNQANLRLSLIRDTVNNYFGTSRLDDVESWPSHYYAERTIGGMTIYLYFVPDQTFEVKVTGKFALAQIANVNTPIIQDPFYTKYLTYELASSICDYYGNPLPAKTEKTLIDLRRSLKSITGIDLSLNTRSMFPGRSGFDSQDAKIWRGWGT